MNQQHGSVHTLFIIGLAAALTGALGFIFWQNFIREEPVVTETEIVKSDNSDMVETVGDGGPQIVDEEGYSFDVVQGFEETSQQMFIFTASLKAERTFINESGDYFEVLVPVGGGGGYSADYFWGYDVEESRLIVAKSDRCAEGDFSCTASNGSVEGIIFDKAKSADYFLGFGNKSKDEIDLGFVDKFISTFRLK